MTIEEHLELGRKWLESQSSVMYCNGTDYFGEEVFGFCEGVMKYSNCSLYICGKFCCAVANVVETIEEIINGENTKAISMLEKNERLIEIGDWVKKKVELNEEILKNYCENICVRHDGNRICLIMKWSDDAIRIGEFLGVGSDYENGIYAQLYAFNEECLDILDRLCEKGTLEYYKAWKFIWDLFIDVSYDKKIKKYKLHENYLELVGDEWNGDRLETLAIEKDGRKIIEFKDFEELETMVNLVRG